MSWQEEAPDKFRLRNAKVAIMLAVFSLVFASSPGYANQPAQPKPPAQTKMYVLTQKSETMGNEVCYVAPDALRIELKSVNCVVFVVKPFTEIVIANMQQKNFFRGVLATWEGRPLKTRGFVRKSLAKGSVWETLSPSEVCAVPAEHMLLLGPQPKRPQVPKARLDYLTARDLVINPTIANAVAQVNGLAKTTKLPLRYQFKNGLSPTATYFDTEKVETRVIDPKLFILPTNFKRVDMDLSVYFAVGEGELDGVNSIIYRSDHADVAVPKATPAK